MKGKLMSYFICFIDQKKLHFAVASSADIRMIQKGDQKTSQEPEARNEVEGGEKQN